MNEHEHGSQNRPEAGEEDPIIAHWKEDADQGTKHSEPIQVHYSRAGGDKKEKEEPVPIPDNMEAFILKLEQEVGYKKSFDVVVREMTFGGKRTALFFMNGFAKDEVLTDILTRLTYLDPSDLSSFALESFFHHYVPGIQVERQGDWNKMMTNVLSGGSALYMDGETELLLIDAKNFPARGPEEPSLERVVRGSRDGFVETMLVNVTLVRRRLRDKQLRYEVLQVGERTHTDVCIAYIDDIVDKDLLESIRDKIKSVKLDGLPLADKQLEEATVKRGWNPFPLVRYSERPDVVAVHLMEGHVAVFVDTTPSVMILPTTYFDLIQHAEENRQTPFIGTYLRWVRFMGIFASLFLLPMWFLFTIQPALKPAALDFIGLQKAGQLPLVAQFLIAELGVDLLRMASVHTPTPLATAMSLIAAILIGDIAVKTGVFVNEVILYMSVAAIGMFATPSYELGLANRIVRLVLIVAVASFKVPGFMLATTAIFIILVMERSFNRPYMWPLIPFDLKGLWNIIFRQPVLYNRTRPNNLKPQQRDKMPDRAKK
ncbi:spore germination protein [Paenibacillus oenotherae]